MKSVLVTLAVATALFVSVEAMAVNCTDFSGDWAFEKGDSQRDLVITQTGCESLTRVNKFPFDYELVQTDLINGAWAEVGKEGSWTRLRKAQMDDNVLILNSEMRDSAGNVLSRSVSKFVRPAQDQLMEYYSIEYKPGDVVEFVRYYSLR